MNSMCCCCSTPPCIKSTPGCNTWNISWSIEAAADNVSKSCLLNGTGCIPNPEQRLLVGSTSPYQTVGHMTKRAFLPKSCFIMFPLGLSEKWSHHIFPLRLHPPRWNRQNAFKQLLCYSQTDSMGLLKHICLNVLTLCIAISGIELEELSVNEAFRERESARYRRSRDNQRGPFLHLLVNDADLV